MIQIENVTKTYSKSRTKAVDDLSLQTRDGEIFGFIGPNGEDHDDQDARRHTQTGQREDRHQRHRLREIADRIKIHHRVRARLPRHLRQAHRIEYLNFIGDIYSVPAKARKANIEKYLAMFNLEKAAGEIIRSYSHGMKQKIIVAAALMHEPRYWILDEPMTGLDPKSAHLLKQEMKAHCAKGNTVFFSTHVLEWSNTCATIGIIDDGMIALGTLEELRSKAQNETSLEKIFFKLTENRRR